ncbi:MAG TPA: hypothetical protein VNX01_11690 [Bacteroidia bacterium]|jgi:hypothetical protein|nr:hypothetical protein [Bacteroidia bacterium]
MSKNLNPEETKKTEQVVDCSHKGTIYSPGDTVCMNGISFVCNAGQWISQGTPCNGKEKSNDK